MPSPPRAGESKEAFISRAIKKFMSEGMPQKQAAAAAFSMWRRKGKKKG